MLKYTTVMKPAAHRWTVWDYAKDYWQKLTERGPKQSSVEYLPPVQINWRGNRKGR